jgi:hypothetical protein
MNLNKNTNNVQKLHTVCLRYNADHYKAKSAITRSDLIIAGTTISNFPRNASVDRLDFRNNLNSFSQFMSHIKNITRTQIKSTPFNFNIRCQQVLWTFQLRLIAYLQSENECRWKMRFIDPSQISHPKSNHNPHVIDDCEKKSHQI